MKLFLRCLLRLWFRFRAYNTEVLDTPGPVLLIPNHVSWLDWLFLGAVLDSDWKFVTSATTATTTWIHRKMMINSRTFPVDTSSPYAAKRMAEFLGKGGRLVLFAEGRITLTGSLMKLFEGTGFLIHRTKAKVITAYLRGANRVLFVRHTGWTQWFPRVSAHFSPVLTAPALEGASNMVARQKITTWLRDAMVRQQFEVEQGFGAKNVLTLIAEAAAQNPRRVVLEDISFNRLTFRRLLVGVDVLASEWRRRWPKLDNNTSEGETRVGLLLPNVNGCAVSLLSLWAADFAPAILNFSTGVPVMLQCAQLAGLKRIITSRTFVEKAKLKLDSFSAAGIELVYLEDVRGEISGLTKLTKLLKHTVRCGWGLRRRADGSQRPAVILFTSGSEGVPKGVELTHGNLVANQRQILGALDVTDYERFFSAMPLFHSFGLMGGVIVPLSRGYYTFLYPSPLHYRVVPAGVYDKACTVMFGTNTFLNGYARRANPYDFNSVKFLVAGAEKVQEVTANTWARKFGVRLLEGYGATECSPAICLNTRMDVRFGSVGRFLPGIEWKIEPVDGVPEGGRLLVRGPNVMRGYLNHDANTKFQALGGWYDTGDIVRVDDDGFVFILGRLKRFAKVSGEMVSLTAVEDALAGAFPQYGARCEVAIITRPDEDKGEVLIAVVNEPRLTSEELRCAIKAKGLTNLCVPRELRVVREIPKLGTGKVNYRELQAQL
ncbi:MAG TPA: AMP-binding protein [Verrucomicrobiota bacterium]|nr:AMP-dependent synthetase [Verrucomicrobiales bacterium]HRI16083.1 AMP-binding protein [Verrucomicrobiota bacterium]